MRGLATAGMVAAVSKMRRFGSSVPRLNGWRADLDREHVGSRTGSAGAAAAQYVNRSRYHCRPALPESHLVDDLLVRYGIPRGTKPARSSLAGDCTSRPSAVCWM